jgi:parallel beta-helix repeat protein
MSCTSRFFGSTSVLFGLMVLINGCSGGSGDAIFSDPTAVIQVDQSGAGDFTTLTDAVEQSPAGALIRVGPGRFQERVLLSKSLRIQGSGPSTIIEMLGSATPDPTDSNTRAVLELIGVSDVVLQDMRFSGPNDGLLVRNSSNVTLINIDASGNGDDGVEIRGSSNVTISGTFTGNGDKGISIREGSSNVTVENAQITGNVDNGLRFRESSVGVLRSSNISGNGDDGVLVRDSSGFVIRTNMITNNAEFGVHLRNSADTTIEGNTIQGNVEGTIRRE